MKNSSHKESRQKYVPDPHFSCIYSVEVIVTMPLVLRIGKSNSNAVVTQAKKQSSNVLKVMWLVVRFQSQPA